MGSPPYLPIFDVNYTNTGAIAFTGLHIHHPGAAGVNGPVTINTGISGTSTVESSTGSGNITRVVAVPSTNTNGIATLNTLIASPENAYVNLHSTQFPGGVVRSQMFPVVNNVSQAAGGGNWISSITIRNPSSTAAVQGLINFFQSSGAAMPEAISDPNLSFLIPPAGSVAFNTHNLGNLTSGFARVFSNGNVTVESRYLHPGFVPSAAAGATVTSRSLSVPVVVGGTAAQNTGISLLANAAGTLTLTLTNTSGAAIAGGSRSMDVTAGQHVVGFVRDLLPSVTATQFSGTLTIATSAGTISVIGLRFNGNLAPVTVTALP